jgi:hypothetical protein
MHMQVKNESNTELCERNLTLSKAVKEVILNLKHLPR